MAALAATWPGHARGGRMATTFPVDLVDGIRSGDRQAIEQAYDAYFTPVMNFVYFILYDYEAARDISQDAFLRVVEAIKSNKSQVRDFKPYLFATARNLAMDEIKRSRKHTSYSTEMMMAQDPNIFVDPARAASLAEQRAQVANAVATMNEHQRTAMVLRDVEGWSYDEIATFMGMSRNAVGVLLSRARLKFRTEFRLQQLDVDALVDECREMLPLMSAVLDGEATEEEKERLQAHLAACPICRQTMEELAGAATTLRSMVPLAPVLAIKIALIGKTATVVGAAAGAAAAGMSVTAKFFVGVVATLLVAGAGMGTYIVVKKAVSNNPAPTAAVTIPAQGETLTREADAEGKAKVVVLVSVDNKPQKVELAIDGQAVKTFDKGPYRYQWTTDAAGPHTVQPTALDASGKKSPGSKVAFTLAITKSMADKIVFARGGSVWLSNPDGSGQRQLTKSGYDDMPAISPDGTKIAFVSHRDRFIRPDKVRHNYEYLTQIYVMDADGGNVRRLTDASTGDCATFGFFPTGDRIVFNRQTDFGGEEGIWRLSVVPVAGGQVSDIATQHLYLAFATFYYPTVSPDGKYVYSGFEGSQVTGGSILRTDVATGGTDTLISAGNSGNQGHGYFLPSLSVDGGTLATAMDTQVTGVGTRPVQLALFDAAGGNKRTYPMPVTDIYGGDQTALGYFFSSWTPDGRLIISAPGYLSGFGNIDPYAEGGVYYIDSTGALTGQVLKRGVSARWGSIRKSFDK